MATNHGFSCQMPVMSLVTVGRLDQRRTLVNAITFDRALECFPCVRPLHRWFRPLLAWFVRCHQRLANDRHNDISAKKSSVNLHCCFSRFVSVTPTRFALFAIFEGAHNGFFNCLTIKYLQFIPMSDCRPTIHCHRAKIRENISFPRTIKIGRPAVYQR